MIDVEENAAQMRNLRANIEASDPLSDALFRENVNEFLRVTNRSIEEFADLTHTSLWTIKRWKSGRNAPHPAMRSHVYEAMLTLLK